EPGLLEQDAAGKNELHWSLRPGQLSGTGERILNQILLRLNQDIGRNLVTAAFVAEDVSPAADLGGFSSGVAAITAGACAAEDENPNRSDLAATFFRGGQRGLEIAGGVAGNCGPEMRRGIADAPPFQFRARAGHADGHGVRPRKAGGDGMEQII